MVIEKLDLLKTDPNYYKVGKEPEIRDLDPYYYLTVSGKCAPADQKFQAAVEKLYAIAYGIKFLAKAEDMDFTVPKMEGFWFIEGGMDAQAGFVDSPKDQWCWKITIRMPDFIEESHYNRALAGAKARKAMEGLEEVKFELINEGRVAQILHIGSYDAETPTIQKLHQFIFDQELEIAGYHHEIYLTDPRKTAHDKLRTVIRYAVK